jgi:hypothetical protein
MVGDLEQEGVKGGRAAAPSRAGGRPSLKTTFCAVGVLTIQAENSVDSQSKAGVLRGGAHAGRTPTCGRGGRSPHHTGGSVPNAPTSSSSVASSDALHSAGIAFLQLLFP